MHLSQKVNTPLKINELSIDKEMDLFQCLIFFPVNERKLPFQNFVTFQLDIDRDG